MNDCDKQLSLIGLPAREELMTLEPEELAPHILFWINKHHPIGGRQPAVWGNYVLSFVSDHEVSNKLSAAWMCLVQRGLLVPATGHDSGRFVPSERGSMFTNEADLKQFAESNLLPRNLLHPEVEKLVRADFVKRDFDTAVFKLFKHIEVEVRDAAGYNSTVYGTALMAAAFAPENGPLTDHKNPDGGEKEALRNLFMGAIGSYKNPHSHRKVNLDPIEATEIIILGNHLLKIVKSRANKP